MMWKIILGIVVVALAGMVGWYISFMGVGAGGHVAIVDVLPSLPDSPLSATYNIEGVEVHLVDGHAEVAVVPGSASKAVTSIWGEPVYGDLDGDGEDDALLLLTHAEGGTGTFYYVAAALRVDEGYLGTNAVLLGDRIAPQTLRLWHEIAVVTFRERAVGTSFADEPRVAVSRYFSLQGNSLNEFGPYENDVQILGGMLVFGHESRTFIPCNTDNALWLSPDSPSLGALRAVYEAHTIDAAPYESVFVVVAGREVAAPEEGFGADYEYAFQVLSVLSAPEGGFCAAVVPEMDAVERGL